MAPHQPDRTAAKACPRVSAYSRQADANCPRTDLLLIVLLVDIVCP